MMNREEFFEKWNCLRCKDCKFYSANDSDYCKHRLDHIKFRKAYPFFANAYDYNLPVCADFSPSKKYPWLYENWKQEYLANYTKDILMGIVVDGDKSIRYMIKYMDYFNNTFLDSKGELKWIEKMYYRQSRKSPIGWELIRETR